VLDLTNWHEFLQCLERAGFRGSKMISSDNALLFRPVLLRLVATVHRLLEGKPRQGWTVA
jgi:hypothetical protein